MTTKYKKYRKQFISRANSRDSLRMFTWNKNNATVYPNFSFQAVVNLLDNDPIARGALNHFIDKCMEGDYSIVKRDTLKYDRDFELLLSTKYEFRNEIMRKTFLLGKLFNNVFIEVVRDSEGKTLSLNVLDSQNIEPITETNGDPIKYRSRIPNPKTGIYPEWKKEDIVWVKFGDRSIGYAPVDLKALWENLCVKDSVRKYIGWLWQTGQYRLLYNFKNSSEQDVQNFLAYARKHDANFKAPFVTKGELETKILRDMKETDSITALLEYLDSQSLVLLRVSPIDAGITDASGRSSADAQSNSFNTSITSFKKVFEDKVNFDLFKKMNKSNSLLRFSPNDRFEESQVWDNVQKMKAVGATNEMMKEYLQDKGMFFAAKMFETVEANPVPNSKEKDMAPSRMRKEAGASNERIGTGEQSTTRPDQL